ncbi:MAG: ubiquitin-like domain-containing protein [Patescibacteria group bacterium]
MIRRGKVMRSRPYISLSVLSVFFFMMGVGGLMVVNAESVGPTDVHIVDITFDGQTKTLPTRAASVADLLSRLEITLGPDDHIEPEVNSLIDSDNYQVNIYRATPVSVTDGDETRRYLSAFNDPRAIAEDVGYQLDPEDIAVFDVDVASGLASLDLANKVIVTRAKDYTVNLYGSRFTKKSHAASVRSLLSDAGIELSDSDVVTPALDAAISSGAEVVVARFGTRIETVVEDIAFKTNTTNDSSLDSGVVNVTKRGIKGSKTVTYEIELQNDIEVSRKLISEVVTTQPVAQEQVRGTKARPVSSNVSADKEFLMSAAGIARSDWGYVDAIISQESGWRPGVVNSFGCIGLGQACPAGVKSSLIRECPNWANDPVCQLRFYRGYAAAYGGWAPAYTFKFCVGNCYSPRTNTTVYKPASNKWW